MQTKTWWAARRPRYNAGLLIAGLWGFVAYVTAVDQRIDIYAPGDLEITAFTTIFQAFAFVVVVGTANVCYLGPLSERLFRPTDVSSYRKIVSGLGFWFSVLLPFTPPVILFSSCVQHSGKS